MYIYIIISYHIINIHGHIIYQKLHLSNGWYQCKNRSTNINIYVKRLTIKKLLLQGFLLNLNCFFMINVFFCNNIRKDYCIDFSWIEWCLFACICLIVYYVRSVKGYQLSFIKNLVSKWKSQHLKKKSDFHIW